MTKKPEPVSAYPPNLRAYGISKETPRLRRERPDEALSPRDALRVNAAYGKDAQNRKK